MAVVERKFMQEFVMMVKNKFKDNNNAIINLADAYENLVAIYKEMEATHTGGEEVAKFAAGLKTMKDAIESLTDKSQGFIQTYKKVVERM